MSTYASILTGSPPISYLLIYNKNDTLIMDRIFVIKLKVYEVFNFMDVYVGVNQ